MARGSMGVPLDSYSSAKQIRATRLSRTYEAVRDDGLPVVARVFDRGEGGIDDRVEHELRRLHQLGLAGVAPTVGIERASVGLVVLSERVVGVELGDLDRGEPMALDTFLPIATRLAELLAELHAHDLVHGDLRPANILVGHDGGDVLLTELGIRLPTARVHDLDAPETLRDVLPYISPEHTGRTRAPIDARSDLYSLGATLDALLCGGPAFVADRASDLIHAHLVERPPTLASRRPKLPASLSRVIAKLLEKAPARRYQTATGLIRDLRRVKARIDAGDLEGVFELGVDDSPGELRPPRRLYGREREQALLVAEIEHATRQARPRLILIEGPASVGKSALASTLELEVLRRRGLLGRGRFEADRQRLPYVGWLTALEQVLDQILAGTTEQLDSWRSRLDGRLGRLAPLVAELLPEVGELLGALADLPETRGPQAAQNRVQLAFSRLLAALSDSGPLVLVLDDLHAADDSSLELLATLLDGGECGAVVLVGTYERGRSRADQRLIELGARLSRRESKSTRVRGRKLRLEPLEDQAIGQIIRDLLGRKDDELARELGRRTGNSPGRTLALARRLVELGLLAHAGGRWRWSESELAAAELPTDIAELDAARLEALEPGAARLLACLACLDPIADPQLLACACGDPPEQLMAGLQQLRAAGLVELGRRGERIADDRLRAHAAAHLSAGDRRALHWRVGRALLERSPERSQICALCVLVDHLDAGLAEPGELSASEREQLVDLNLDAGRRALAVAAHGPALRYLELAAALVAEQLGEVRERGGDVPGAATVLEICFARAQALALAGEVDAAETAFEELLEWRLSMPDYSRIVGVWVQLLTIQDRIEAAVKLGLAGLRRCGLDIDPRPGDLTVLAAVVRLWLGFRRRSNASLTTLPPATDEAARAAMEIATLLGASAYNHDPKLFMLLSCSHAGLVLRHGNHSSAPLAIAQCAMAISTVLRRAREGARLADCAMILAGDLEHPDHARAEIVTHMVWHFTRPFESTLEGLEAAYQRNLELGEFEFVSYLATLNMSMSFEIGTPLRTLIEIGKRLERELGNWASPTMTTLVRLNGALAAALAGDLDAGFGEIVQGEAGMPRVMPIDPDSLHQPTQMQLYTTKMCQGMFFVLLAEYELGLHIFDEIADYHRVMLGSWSVPRAAVGYAVAAAACHALPEIDGSERRRLRKIVERGAKITRRWAETCPDNYAHHHDLVLAELTQLRGDFHRALELLEQARDHAKRNGCAYVAALACERLAAHMQARALPTLALGPLREAWLIYSRWGARAKLRALEHDHSLAGGTEALSMADGDPGAPSLRGIGNLAIDLETVTRAIAAISEELDPELLACKVLEAAMTHANADHGALLIELDGDLTVAALGEARRVHALSPPLSITSALDILPMNLIDLIVRDGGAIVVDDARTDPRFARDPYVERTKLRSLLCITLSKRQRRLGMLVLENRDTAASFTEERLSVLGFIATSAGSAIDNANLYRALRRSEVQWRSLVDGAPDLIALLNANGELSFVNRSLPGWVSRRRPILDPDSRDAWSRAIAGALEHGQRGAVEIALLHADDDEQLHWFDAHVAPLEIEGEPRQVMVIATEITERKLAESRRLELEGQLRQQQRLESLGTLASGVAHEINNPVQGILNYAELIAHSRTEPELVDEFAGEITIEAERVARIVRSLLAFSRREASPERELRTIAEVLEGTISLIRSTLRTHAIELELDLAEGLPRIRCHSQQIQQIVMNLVTNARDALNERYPKHHEKKRIAIRVGTIQRRGRAMVRIAVIDHGGGIPEHVRAHIFDPFFTTKGRDQGTGLGLSVSHGIAADHGGELSVESKVGVETSFFLDLPAVE